MDSVSVATEVSALTSRVNPAPKRRNPKDSNAARKLLLLTDGRTAAARRFRDLYADIVADLGGADLLSTGQMQLARRAALISAELERVESFWARDERVGPINWRDEPDKFDANMYGVLCDRLGRLFDRLGLERRQRPVANAVIEHFARPAEGRAK